MSAFWIVAKATDAELQCVRGAVRNSLIMSALGDVDEQRDDEGYGEECAKRR